MAVGGGSVERWRVSDWKISRVDSGGRAVDGGDGRLGIKLRSGGGEGVVVTLQDAAKMRWSVNSVCALNR